MQTNIPLAERLRPRTLDEYIGQEHLVGPDGVFRRFLETGNVPSFILWGPPGVGKTTLARLVATALDRKMFTLSAINAGVKDVREVIEQARKNRFFNTPAPFLFIDEIHRFNKSQQDSLLGAVEQGIVTLVGATTENPSFEVISPLLSRCQVYVLKAMEESDLQKLLDRAIATDTVLQERKVRVEQTAALFRFSGGDARKLLNIIDILSNATEGEIVISDRSITECLQQNIALYDKNGEQHYDVISAFIKSVRGSDPNAAIYYLARMLAGGEDPKFIARRLVILASEDIGLANPNGLLLANACFDTVHKIGMPEARITLAETTIYLATSPKSNSAYMAIDAAAAEVRAPGHDEPSRSRCISAMRPPSLMKELGYGENYRYAARFRGSLRRAGVHAEGHGRPPVLRSGRQPERARNRTADPHVVERKVLITKTAFRTCGQKPARDNRPRRRIAGKRLRDFRTAAATRSDRPCVFRPGKRSCSRDAANVRRLVPAAQSGPLLKTSRTQPSPDRTAPGTPSPGRDKSDSAGTRSPRHACGTAARARGNRPSDNICQIGRK